jgi:hypothetical protein
MCKSVSRQGIKPTRYKRILTYVKAFEELVVRDQKFCSMSGSPASNGRMRASRRRKTARRAAERCLGAMVKYT